IVGDYDKARALIERGLRLLKENPAGLLRVRLSRESTLYLLLGDDLLRRGQYDEAINALLQAVAGTQDNFDFYRDSIPRGQQAENYRQQTENYETKLIECLIHLARAYQLAGRLNDALNSYQEASKHVAVGGARVIYEQDVYLGLGEVFLQQKQL